MLFNEIIGFAQEVPPQDLPFIVNWASGAEVKQMQVDDSAVMTALVELMRCIDRLQPNINGKSSIWKFF